MFLALFCTIVILLITVNDGAPTNPKGGPSKVQVAFNNISNTVSKPPNLAGGRGPWLPKIDSRSKKLFKDYKKVILKKIQATHKGLPKFVPKPDRVALQSVSGIIHHYLVKLPTKQYAYITISKPFGKDDKYGTEARVTVKPTLYALNDKNI